MEKIALACDHRGFPFKEKLKHLLTERGFKVLDCGTHSEESTDYNDPIVAAAEKISTKECPRAVGICYTGIGSSIMANKVYGVRAALCKSIEEAKLSRQHNDANMLILGAGFLQDTQLLAIVENWLNASFEGGRHERRVNKIKDYEQKHIR